ncbi:pyrroline-5-carboxylate reductase family protein [Methylobacterium nodulans]|uniref:NADP oxidoreductase coenzyme F420-dependent n=1 Tax=Methylobacterium nodulans (strain LMG 21967 / CNCM I-2342 / ORS 2060) TaxID=460265 RepID=B8ISK9_METNO|nr:NAD(P)-binding domain-containing protein [Methylobacterium nodulans]ACL58849.1 conserved hypothetical protein [Methylobacterium nodulans ORS 2060]
MEPSITHVSGSTGAVGVLGAGRLGDAVAARMREEGKQVVMWSRRFEDPASRPSAGRRSGDDLGAVIQSRVIFSAIPNQALVSLSKRGDLRSFDGVMFALGIDAEARIVRDALPNALVVRLSPAIPQDGGEVRSIGLLDNIARADPRVSLAIAALQPLGPASWIEEEQLYDLVTLLAGPLLTLIRSALTRTIEAGLAERGLTPAARDHVMDVVFNELTRRLRGRHDASKQAEGHRATPGGVTEVALSHSTQVSEQLGAIVDKMLGHMQRLRVPPQE